MNDVTIIRVRRGVNGHRYSACDYNGNFLGNFDKLSEVRKHWLYEIRHGMVQLVRELDKQPDFTAINETRKMIETYLRYVGNKKKRK